MTANNAAIAAAVTQRRGRVQFHDPVGHLGPAGFFSPISTATLKFRVFPIFSAERFAILGAESLALRISADWRGPSGWSQSRRARGSLAARMCSRRVEWGPN